MEILYSSTSFVSDGCTLFPDLWFRSCCISHDLAEFNNLPRFESDIKLLSCIAKESNFLGPVSFIFAGLIVTGMSVFRPAYMWYKHKIRQKE